MPLQTCMGATLRCTFGAAPNELIVLPVHHVLTNERLDANISDHKSMVNIMSFGMCISEENPAVEAATAAALGVPTPAPCIPATVMPWALGAETLLLDGEPSLSSDSKLMCLWAGMITIIEPGERTVEIP